MGLNSHIVKGKEPGTVNVIPSFKRAVDSLTKTTKDEDHEIGKQCDIYAFGLVLLNMLTHKNASKNVNVHKLLECGDEIDE